MPRADRKRFSIRDYVGFGLLAVIGFVCIQAQLDYAVEKRSAVSNLVVPGFREMAHAPVVDSALAVEAPERALAAARKLVFARPVPSENLTRLAQAQVLSGNDLAASDSLIAAAGRGWRDPIAQIAILQGAIEVGEWEVVAQRFSAARKLRFPQEITNESLRRLSVAPEGRAALAEQLGADPAWLRNFARLAPAVMEGNAFRNILETALARNDDPDDCEVRSIAAVALLKTGEGKATNAIWTPQCSQGFADGLNVTGFEDGALAKSGPFAWTYPPGAGLRKTFVTKSGGTFLRYDNSARIRRLLTHRLLSLPDGRYVLTVENDRPALEGRSRTQPVKLELTCHRSQERIAASRPNDLQLAVSIPSEECEVQWLRLTVEPGTGQITGIGIERVSD